MHLYDALKAERPLKLFVHEHMGKKRFIGKLVSYGGALFYVTRRDVEQTQYHAYGTFGITDQVIKALHQIHLEERTPVYIAVLEEKTRKVYLSSLWDWLNSPLKVSWNREVQVHLPLSNMSITE